MRDPLSNSPLLILGFFFVANLVGFQSAESSLNARPKSWVSPWWEAVIWRCFILVLKDLFFLLGLSTHSQCSTWSRWWMMDQKEEKFRFIEEFFWVAQAEVLFWFFFRKQADFVKKRAEIKLKTVSIITVWRLWKPQEGWICRHWEQFWVSNQQ